eukprot:817987-Amphidinium_carterae.1
MSLCFHSGVNWHRDNGNLSLNALATFGNTHDRLLVQHQSGDVSVMKTFRTWTIFDPREKHSSVSDSERYSLVAYSRVTVPDEVRHALNLAGFRPLPSDYHQQTDQQKHQPVSRQAGVLSPTLLFPSQNTHLLWEQHVTQRKSNGRCAETGLQWSSVMKKGTSQPSRTRQKPAQKTLQLVKEYVAKNAAPAHSAQNIVGEGKRHSSETSISRAATKVHAAVGETLSKRLVNRLVEDSRTSEHILKANSVTQTRDAVAAALRRSQTKAREEEEAHPETAATERENRSEDMLRPGGNDRPAQGSLPPDAAQPQQPTAAALPGPPPAPYWLFQQPTFAAPPQQQHQTQQPLISEQLMHLATATQRLHTEVSQSFSIMQRHQQALAQGLLELRTHVDVQFQVHSAQIAELPRSEQLATIADNLSLVAAGHQDFYIDFVDQRERWLRKFDELQAALACSVPPTQYYQPQSPSQEQQQQQDRDVVANNPAAASRLSDDIGPHLIDSGDEGKEPEALAS